MNHLKKEIKLIKWTKPKDVIKQTAYILVITIIIATFFAFFDLDQKLYIRRKGKLRQYRK